MIRRLLTLILAVAAIAPTAASQTHYWDTDTLGDWDTPGRWSAGTTPNDPSAWAVIGVSGAPYTVTMDISPLLDRFTLNAASATLAMSAKTMTVTSPAVIDAGTLRMINSVIAGGGQVTNNSLIQALGTSSIENLYNDGTLDVLGSPAGGTSSLTLTAPAYSEGVINMTSENAGYQSQINTAAGTTLSNFGTLNVMTGAGGNRIFNGALDNNFLVAIGQSATFNTGPISNSQNTFHVFPTHTATFGSGCDFNMNGGILNNEGTFRMTNSAFTWDGGELQNQAPDLINNTMTIGPLNLDLGAVRLHGTSSLTGTLRSGQTLNIVGSPSGSTANLTWLGTGEQHSNGNINVLSESAGYQSQLTVASGASLKNTGTISVDEGAAGNRFISGEIFNDQGQVLLHRSTRMVAGPFENKGLWQIDTDQLMDFNSAVNWRQTGGTLQIDGRFYHANGVDEFMGGNVVGIVELVNSQLTLDSAFTGTFTGWAQGSSTLTGDVESGQTLHVRGAPAGSTATLNLAGSTENRGTIIVDSTNAGYQASLGTTDVVLTNSGTLEVQPGAGGNRFLTGDITNNGALVIDANTTMTDGPMINEGAWTINSGSQMSFNSAMEFQQNAGTLQIDGTFYHVNGTDIFNGGTVNGVVELVNSSLTLGPAFVDPVTLLVQGSSTLDGDLESGQTLHVRGSSAGSTATMNLAGPTENRGDLIVDSVQAGHQSSMGTVDQPFLNSGNFTVEVGAGGSRFITGDFTNDGTAQFNTTTRLQDGPVVNNGTFGIAATKTVDFASAMTFEQAGGTLQIDGTFKHTNGTDRFSGGTVNGVPQLINSQLFLESGFTTPVQIDMLGSSGLTGDIESGQTVRVLGASAGSTATMTAQAPLSNRGEIIVTSEGAGHQSNLSAPAGQEIANEGTISVIHGAGGAKYLTMALNNSGLVDIGATTTVGMSGADHQNSGTIEVRSGSTFSGSSFTNLDGGRFEADVTITNSTLPMHNDGVWAQGFGIGSMHLTGAWSQGSTGKLEIEIGGLAAGTEHDQLSVNTTATLDGEVMLKAANGFQPKFGDQFTILTCSSTSGDFTGVTYDGNLPLGYGFQLVNTGNSVIAQVVQTIIDAGSGSTVDVRLSDPVPGQAGRTNHFQANGLTGNGAFAMVYGTAAGTTPAGICAADFGIDQAAQLGTGIASADGVGLVSVMVPAAASGVTAYFQVLDVERCEVSTVNTFLFP